MNKNVKVSSRLLITSHYHNSYIRNLIYFKTKKKALNFFCPMKTHVSFLGAFAKLWKVTISFVTCLSVRLSCLPVCPVCPSVCLSVCPVCLSVLCVCPSAWLSVRLPVSLSVYPVCLSVYLSVRLLVLCVCLSVRLPVCLSCHYFPLQH